MEKNSVTEGLEDGIIATIVMTIPMMLVTVAGKSPMPEPFPKAIVERVVGEDASKGVVLPLTVLSHLFYGGTNGAVLATVGRSVTLRKGLAWGVGLWGIMEVAFMPFVGWGLFGRKLREGRTASVMALMLHLVYGATLGVLLKRDEEGEPAATKAQQGPPAKETERNLVDVNVEW